MSLNETPKGERLHIGIFGRVNSGKSSLLNALTGQSVSLVSPVAGTTADAVEKAMELPEVGPVLFLDTAGIADAGELGALRGEATERAARRTDIALLLFGGADGAEELALYRQFSAANIPVIPVVSKIDELSDGGRTKLAALAAELGEQPLPVSVKQPETVAALREKLQKLAGGQNRDSLTGELCGAGDTVLLVMPQDIEAPVGRLILPQVQTIRELLDKRCLISCCTADQYEASLAAMAAPPRLIIIDSQVFPLVYAKKPAASKLTSFSILFAAYKGDIEYFAASARLLPTLAPTARILIAESCTHVPLTEDIGRVKIPALLRKKLGDKLVISFANGPTLPDDFRRYDLVIQCGGCMVNRRFIMNRVAAAKAAGVPMTNYGIAIAALTGILDKVALPRPAGKE